MVKEEFYLINISYKYQPLSQGLSVFYCEPQSDEKESQFDETDYHDGFSSSVTEERYLLTPGYQIYHLERNTHTKKRKETNG